MAGTAKRPLGPCLVSTSVPCRNPAMASRRVKKVRFPSSRRMRPYKSSWARSTGLVDSGRVGDQSKGPPARTGYIATGAWPGSRPGGPSPEGRLWRGKPEFPGATLTANGAPLVGDAPFAVRLRRHQTARAIRSVSTWKGRRSRRTSPPVTSAAARVRSNRSVSRTSPSSNAEGVEPSLVTPARRRCSANPPESPSAGPLSRPRGPTWRFSCAPWLYSVRSQRWAVAAGRAKCHSPEPPCHDHLVTTSLRPRS